MNKTSTQLTRFVGGYFDGDELEVPASVPYWVLPVYPPVDVQILGNELGVKPPEVTYERYRRSRLRGESKTFEVMVSVDMSFDQLLTKLIEGYSP